MTSVQTARHLRESEPCASLGTTCKITVPSQNAERCLWRLRRFRLQSLVCEIIPEGRIVKCLRNLIPQKDGVEVWQKGDRANFKNLQVCASVWACPVCAARISEVRRVDLQQGIARWRAGGGSVLMATQTIPHRKCDLLAYLLRGFSDARTLMHNRKAWRVWVKKVGLAGSIRALEVTFGFGSGWHVHVHELEFFKGEVDPLDMQVAQYYMWRDACKSVGLEEPSFRRGLQVQNGDQAGEYASKWGLDSELAKSHLKSARGGNYGPFDLVNRFGEVEGREKEIVCGLFREYAKAFHGKRQLVWSRGLRALVGLENEKSDAEVAASVPEESLLLGSLTRQEWGRVVRAEKRGELLEIAASKGWQGVLDFVDKLRSASRDVCRGASEA